MDTSWRYRAAVLALLAATVVALTSTTAAAGPAPDAARVISPGHARAPRGGTTTIGLGLTRSNSNAQLAETIPAAVRPSWAASPPRSSCLNEPGEFAVTTTATTRKYTVVLESENCERVSVYRTGSGKLVWRRAYFEAPQIVTDKTYVYVLSDSVQDSYTVEAVKISSGKRRWKVPASYDATNLVTGSGVVVDGSQVLRAKTGKGFFLPDPTVITSSRPQSLVIDGRIIRNSTGEVSAWTPTGTLLWRYQKPETSPSPGWGETVPQAHAGRLYVRSEYPGPTLVLDEATGIKVGTLQETVQPMAFDGHIGIVVSQLADGSHLAAASAVDLSDGYVYWTRSFPAGDFPSLDRHFATPPVIENGLVWFVTEQTYGDAPTLIALDEVTGEIRSESPQTCRLRGHEDETAAGTISVAQHRLFVPGPCGLQTYVAAR